VETEQLNSAAIVGEVTSRDMNLEHQCSTFSKLFDNFAKHDKSQLSTGPNVYLTSRRARLSASAELLV